MARPNSYKIIEKFRGYAQPVGSVVTIEDKRALYRNIDDKHILSKNGYKALCIDDAVINDLIQNDQVNEVVFEHKDKGVYRIPFSIVSGIPAVFMAGRKQRRISLDNFIHEDKRFRINRPDDAVYIEAN